MLWKMLIPGKDRKTVCLSNGQISVLENSHPQSKEILRNILDHWRVDHQLGRSCRAMI